VSAVVTDKASLPTELVVIAIGVVPNTEWLADPDPAAGDCASVGWFDGSRRPEQLWYTARDQGRVAGRRLLGDSEARYRRGTWYNSAKLMDLEYTTAGRVNLDQPDERNWTFVERGAVKSSTRIVTSGDQVIGFNLLGRRWDHSVLIRWIDEGRALEHVVAHLGEAAFDTELVPKLIIPPGHDGFTRKER
jgi:NADPH-dependent 2,4-dienoyl-CoA reductase/sulfur reductase-like enzyme